MFYKRNSKGMPGRTQDALAQKIASQIVSSQRQLASFLNRRTAHFSRTQKRVLLLAISVFFTGVSLFLIFTGIF